MKKPRRQFTDEFKADAVQLVIQGQRPIAQVARELEINESSLGYWVKNYRQANPDPQTAPAPVDAARYARLEAENRRLAEENAFLKKGRGLLREGTAVSVKFQLIHEEKAHHTIGLMTRLLKVSRAGYYAWAKRQGTTTPSGRRRDELAALIKQIDEDKQQTYGFRRMLHELARRGVTASAGLVRKLMRQLGVHGVQPRASKRTTIPALDAQDRPDWLRRDFTAEQPGQRFVGDITYLRTGEGWLYLATVIDLYNREVVGWSMADHMRVELVSDALTMAHTHGRIGEGAVFHSDRGSVYTSAAYAELAEQCQVKLSVGRTGVCWDNAVAESFFSMLKNEMYHRQAFATRGRARFAVMEYIEVFYNRGRLHSTLGYRTPVEVRHAYERNTDHQNAVAA
ncbi:IS3-like element ISGmo1 family transposase [Gulosibacter molinativorax]|uniref:IS3-like element ISGmo1 family transposase n=1 Tax=Gulosibacter molinativorax TaxID=256821 RepID=A0ABT7CCX9_9MICO|nr:IS3-like element ISGmo1 family transposase [Gulosibacter molinativorax]MDJ1372584.1 IS3-like element ISGmo1 family transposase [Gulosibacter molinativorax]